MANNTQHCPNALPDAVGRLLPESFFRRQYGQHICLADASDRYVAKDWHAERFGVSDAAVERGVKAIGNVIDTSGDYPETIMASALWHMEPTIDRAIATVANGTFEAADYGPYSCMG